MDERRENVYLKTMMAGLPEIRKGILGGEYVDQSRTGSGMDGTN
jgi:hypothetical protein